MSFDLTKLKKIPFYPFLLGSHFFFLALCQIENYGYYIFPSHPILLNLYHPPLSLPFIHLENLFFLFTLAMLFLFVGAGKWAQRFSFVLTLVLNGYLIVNQVAYKLYFSPLHFSMAEQNLSLITYVTGSALFELDFVFYFNLILFFLISGLQYSRLGKSSEPLLKIPRSKKFWVRIAVYSLVSAPIILMGQHHHLDKNPFLFSQRGIEVSPTTIPAVQQLQTQPIKDLYHPIYGTSQETSDFSEIQKQVADLQQSAAPYNIILFVLESIGSKQLFSEQGDIFPEVAPFLSKLLQNAILFPEIRTVYPGTIRTHIPLMTGGSTLTYGSVYYDLAFSFSGKTLVSELSKKGYHTALFGSSNLASENMDQFYGQLGYDTICTLDRVSPEEQSRWGFNEWGGMEEPFLEKTLEWIEKQPREKPFFVQYLTTAAHHPYNFPANHPLQQFHPEMKKNVYLNCIHYLDRELDSFYQRLQSLRSLDRTILFFVGDHGEAFAEFHPKNRLHKHHVYEENIKTFFWMVHPSIKKVISRRSGSIGDLAPSIMALLGETTSHFLGQSLLASEFPLKLHYFYKNSYPEQWGVVDGQWKWISTLLGDEVELYDLASDPHEQKNLANLNKEQCQQYEQYCATWFVEAQKQFTNKLQNYQPRGQKNIRPEDFKSAGLKSFAFGYYQHPKEEEGFRETKSFLPQQRTILWQQWVSFRESAHLRYEWISPSAKLYENHFELQTDWSIIWIKNPAPIPLESGAWRLNIYHDQNRLLSETFFVVEEEK